MGIITQNGQIVITNGNVLTYEGAEAPTLQSKIISPTTSQQMVTADPGYDGLSSVQINLTTQAAQTLYPSTSDQTISSGKYLTGTQTFKGVLLTNLDAGNIKKDVVVKVGDSADDDRITSITGTYAGATPPYSVAIFLTNPSDSEYFHWFCITEQITSDGWQDHPPSGDGSYTYISSPTGATIVKIDTSSYGFRCEIDGGPDGAVWPNDNHFTCTGGVTHVGINSWGEEVFQVTGDGTVIIDGIIWND